MGQARRTTLEERIEIVKANLESGRKEFEIAARYKVSRDQVRYWTNRYLELGEIALEDRRGRRKKDQVRCVIVPSVDITRFLKLTALPERGGGPAESRVGGVPQCRY